VVSHTVFRSPATPISHREEDAEDLLEMIRRAAAAARSDPVRLEISSDADETFVGC